MRLWRRRSTPPAHCARRQGPQRPSAARSPGAVHARRATRIYWIYATAKDLSEYGRGARAGTSVQNPTMTRARARRSAGSCCRRRRSSRSTAQAKRIAGRAQQVGQGRRRRSTAGSRVVVATSSISARCTIAVRAVPSSTRRGAHAQRRPRSPDTSACQPAPGPRRGRPRRRRTTDCPCRRPSHAGRACSRPAADLIHHVERRGGPCRRRRRRDVACRSLVRSLGLCRGRPAGRAARHVRAGLERGRPAAIHAVPDRSSRSRGRGCDGHVALAGHRPHRPVLTARAAPRRAAPDRSADRRGPLGLQPASAFA